MFPTVDPLRGEITSSPTVLYKLARFIDLGFLVLSSRRVDFFSPPFSFPPMANSDSEFRCFVGGLAWATDDASLERAFSPFGEIIESKVICVLTRLSTNFLLLFRGSVGSYGVRCVLGADHQ